MACPEVTRPLVWTGAGLRRAWTAAACLKASFGSSVPRVVAGYHRGAAAVAAVAAVAAAVVAWPEAAEAAAAAAVGPVGSASVLADHTVRSTATSCAACPARWGRHCRCRRPVAAPAAPAAPATERRCSRPWNAPLSPIRVSRLGAPAAVCRCAVASAVDTGANQSFSAHVAFRATSTSSIVLSFLARLKTEKTVRGSRPGYCNAFPPGP